MTVNHKLERGKIIKAAAAIIAGNGKHNFKTKALADNMGVSRGKIQYYFNSSQEIIDEAFLWVNTETMKKMRKLVNNAHNVNDIVSQQQFLDPILPLNKATDIEWKVRVAYWEYTYSCNDASRVFNETSQNQIDTIANIIQTLQTNGVVRTDIEADSIASQIFHLVKGLSSTLIYMPMYKRREFTKSLYDYLNLIAA